MSSAQWVAWFGGAKREISPAHNEVPNPQPPGDGGIDNPDSHLCFRFHTVPSSPLPSVVTADNADFNIFTLAELFAFRCNYEARHSLLRAASRNVGRTWYPLGGQGGSEAGQSGPGGAEPHRPAFQRECLGGTYPTLALLQACIHLVYFFHPRAGRGVGWGTWVRAVSSQSLLCARHYACPQSWPLGTYICTGGTGKKLTSK